MKSIWRNSIFLLTGIILFCCRGPQRLNEFDLADGYLVNGLQYEMDATFHSLNDSISNLLVKINPNDLLFAKTESDKHIARYTIGYKVFEGYNDKAPIDTATIHYSFRQGKAINSKIHNIKIYAPSGKDYIVKVFLKDENRNFETSKIQTHRKSTPNDRSYFKIKSCNKQANNFTSFQKDSFSIESSFKHESVVKVMVFQYKTTCAAKPHEVNHSYNFGGIPDTVWYVNLKEKLVFPPLKNAYYHFLTDTQTSKGFSVFSVSQGFPQINSIVQANGALGYLLGKSDYADVLRAPNQRKAFENQWLTLAGNRQRARNMIKEYYSEVSIANKLFTCNQPGWSTDRGMVYIIYGPPRIVYRYDNSEVWIYGEENNLLSEQFEFKKIHSDISDNIYELKRNINFKVNFNRMVNAWIDERGY